MAVRRWRSRPAPFVRLLGHGSRNVLKRISFRWDWSKVTLSLRVAT